MRNLQAQIPFNIPLNKNAIGAGASGKATHKFTFDCTVFAIHSAVKGSDAPHADFRADIKINGVKISNKPFSIRSLTKDNSGFIFELEMGDNYYFKSGESIAIVLYNDTSGEITPSIQLIVARGWIPSLTGKNKLEHTDFAGLNFLREKKQILPYLQVIEPNATIANGANTTVIYDFDRESTILAIHSAARATAAGAHHKDFQTEIEIGSINSEVPSSNASARCLSVENNGFDFIKHFKKPLIVETNQVMRVKFTNNSGGNLWASLILLGFTDYLAPAELKKFIEMRK